MTVDLAAEPALDHSPGSGGADERFADVESVHPLAATAMRTIDHLMARSMPCVSAFSSGKDSSVLVGMMLAVAAGRVADGLPVPRLLVIHSDAGVESPEVRQLADRELKKMVEFANAKGVSLEVRVGKPSLYVSWPVRVIGGRALPSFPTSHRDCSVDLKVLVGQRLTNEAFGDLVGDPDRPQPVLMTGVRLDESAERGASIRARGESAEELWADPEGRLRISPIIHWSSDDVFEYLGYANAGVIKTYSDFSDTMQFYRDAGGSSCAVIGDMRLAEDVAKEKGGCGARGGCWTCVRVQKDKSLETMIETDLLKYGYMQGLNRLRNFIANTQYDWDRRTYLGRTIDDDGDVAVKADVYSPAMLEELLRYTLTLQFKEVIAAARKGIAPRFEIIGYREIIAIDALWSLYALHPPFHAIKILNEIRSGRFVDVPASEVVPRSPVPNYGKLHVGTAWNSDLSTGDPKRDRMLSGGIRSHMHELVSESCGDARFGIKQLSNGDLVTAWDTVGSFEVDEEGAGDWIECFGEEAIAKHHDADVDRTVAVRTYLSMGFLTPAHASLGRWNSIAMRSQWMQRHGLVGQVQRGRLLAMMEVQAAGRNPFHADAVAEIEQRAAELELGIRTAELGLRRAGAPGSTSADATALRIDDGGFVDAPDPGAPELHEIAAALEAGFQRDLFAEQEPSEVARDPARGRMTSAI